MVLGTTCKIEVEIVSQASLTFRQQFATLESMPSTFKLGPLSLDAAGDSTAPISRDLTFLLI